MPKQSVVIMLLAGLILGGFVYGLITLLHLRYGAGDVYPPYSSLRADPLGAKALYEGIQEVQGLRAARNYALVPKLHEQTGITLLYLGLHPGQFFWVEKEVVAALESLLLHGNRVVLTFSPVHQAVSSYDFWDDEDENDDEKTVEDGDNADPETPETEEPADEANVSAPKEDASQEEKAAPEEEASDDDADFPSGVDLADFAIDLPEKWGVAFGYTPLTVTDDNVYETLEAVRATDEPLPKSLSWHTALYFEPSADKQWKTVYAASGQPVIIERQFGKGTLVLCADSYFVSNEALQVERHADLLAWLLGAQTTVMFDEVHLGVMENPGIATLIRKYRLMGFVGSLIVLALLFVWQNIVSFVPPADDAALLTEERAGKDNLGGLINLLRQNIPARKILPVCVAEWEKSVSHRRQELGSVITDIHALVDAETTHSAHEQEPVETYRLICRALENQR